MNLSVYLVLLITSFKYTYPLTSYHHCWHHHQRTNQCTGDPSASVGMALRQPIVYSFYKTAACSWIGSIASSWCDDIANVYQGPPHCEIFLGKYEILFSPIFASFGKMSSFWPFWPKNSSWAVRRSPFRNVNCQIKKGQEVPLRECKGPAFPIPYLWPDHKVSTPSLDFYHEAALGEVWNFS